MSISNDACLCLVWIYEVTRFVTGLEYPNYLAPAGGNGETKIFINVNA